MAFESVIFAAWETLFEQTSNMAVFDIEYDSICNALLFCNNNQII